MPTISSIEPIAEVRETGYNKTLIPISGSSTHVILEFPFEESFIYLGSLVSISYSTYRDKSPVFVCGSPEISGFAIGNRYVAGSMILNMCLEDELSSFLNKQLTEAVGKKTALTINEKLNKSISSYTKDDLMSFNITIIFTSEYHQDASAISIYGATFVNNGQVMSIEDLVTENTLSYVAKSIKEQYVLKDGIVSLPKTMKQVSGTSLLKKIRNFT